MIKDIIKYCKKNTNKPENNLIEIYNSGIDYAPQSPTMSTNHYTGQFFKTLLLIHKPKTIIEIGSFVGYLTYIFNNTCPDAKIFCIDRCPNAMNLNIQNNKKNKNFKNIKYILGNAVNIVNNIFTKQKFDLIFIDADKNNYQEYIKWAMDSVNTGGMIIIDNALWRGRVLSPEKDGDFSVNKANEILSNNEKFENILLNIDDGVHIAIKSSN